MTTDSFRQLLAKTKKKTLWVSFLIILTGGMFFIPIFTGDSKIVYWVFGLIFVLLGLFILLKSIADLNKIKSGQLPLLRAIEDADRGFVIWMYVQEINSKVEGIKVGTTNNVVVFDRNHKMESIILSRKGNPHDVLNFLCQHFPESKVGYTDEYIKMFSKKK